MQKHISGRTQVRERMKATLLVRLARLEGQKRFAPSNTYRYGTVAERLYRRSAPCDRETGAHPLAEFRVVPLRGAARTSTQGRTCVRLASLDKSLQALERKISIDPLPPFVVCGENESGVAELLL